MKVLTLKYKVILLIYTISSFIMQLSFSQTLKTKHDSLLFCTHLADNIIKIQKNNDSTIYYYINDNSIIRERWDTLSQVIFWQKILKLSPDSTVINIASNRKIINIIPTTDIKKLNDKKKNLFKDSIRKINNLDSNTKIFLTSGKSHYYDFSNVLDNLTISIPIFIENGVDPWYAQAILLIESPAKIHKSCAGAYGHFQLIKPVAKKYGLKVNKYIDERVFIDRSAYAAAQFIKRVCIPSVKKILNTFNIKYKENDLFFKLLVLHAYHAGPGNLFAAIRTINPCENGIPLFIKLWNTEAQNFKNSSQNYSQIALAAILNFKEYIENTYLINKHHPITNKELSQ